MNLNKKLSDLFEVKEKEPELLFREMDRMGKLDNKKMQDILLVIIKDLAELHKQFD